MTRVTRFLIAMLISFSMMTPALAGEFEWLDNLNIRAEADSSGFSMELATRFKIGSTDVKAVIGNVDRPSDAYMVLRLGELSHKPIQQVLHVYSANKNRGWGVMAKQLGIKPGSREFHALKRGHDLHQSSQNGGGSAGHAKKGNSKVKHANKSNGKGKWK